MNHLLKFLLAVSLLGLNTYRIFANGFSILNQDAFATARGQAFVATADNPSAIYYNPAGIAQLDGDNLRSGACGFDLNTTFKAPDTSPQAGNAYHSAYHYAAAPQGFYTHTFEKWPVSLGLGIYAPFGGSIDWPDDTGFRTQATEGRLLYLSFNPVLALKLSSNLSLAAGVTVNYVKLDLKQGIQPNDFFPNFFKFKGDGWSVDYNLGALWKPIKQLSFGAMFRSSAPVNLQGNTKVENQPLFSEVMTPANMHLTFPLSAVVGASYRPTPKWNLKLDANYTGWDSFGQTSINQAQVPAGTFGLAQNIAVNLDWQSSWTIEFGITRYFDNGLHVSAGYAYDENSVPDQYYTPFAADLDRHFFSIGAGFKGKTFDFDLAYQFGYGPSHDVSDSQAAATAGTTAENGNGKYSFNSSALMISAGLHF